MHNSSYHVITTMSTTGVSYLLLITYYLYIFVCAFIHLFMQASNVGVVAVTGNKTVEKEKQKMRWITIGNIIHGDKGTRRSTMKSRVG